MFAREWALATSKTSESTDRASELIRQVGKADFRAVLAAEDVKAALRRVPKLLDGLQDTMDVDGSAKEDEHEILLASAVALQHAFVQANWTGPDLEFTPAEVVAWITGTDSSDKDAMNTKLNAASMPYLTLLGEPAYHLAAHPALLLLSIRVLKFLAEQKAAFVTLPWWRLRSHLVHLALLDEAVPLDDEIVGDVGALIPSAPDADTAAMLSLELGLLHFRLGQDKPANQAFLTAARASGLEFELTGALGKRTKFQTQDFSQLLLLAESRKREGEEGNVPPSKGAPEALALNDDTLLEETEYTTTTRGSGTLSHLDPGNQPSLHPLDQALLLSLCLNQSNSSPAHGLTTQQMMPFVQRVVSHPVNWSVHTTALLLRSRLESNRSRTVERSALQLAALIDQMPTSDSEASERLQYFHQLPLPSKWEMEKELAKRYLSLGVIKSALDIFTRLEMWEDAVSCLQYMEREAEAERIVRDLLEGRKLESDVVQAMGRASLSDSKREKLGWAREAKLWCLLGDLALNADDAPKNPQKARETAIGYYNKAWEVSRHSSSRSQRSLGSLYTSAKDYESAIPAFRHALAINPLYRQAWFTLGVCLMQLGRWSEARDAFKRQVGVAEDDSEGWNNLAAVYLRMNEEGVPKGEKPPPVSFENKQLAYHALRSGLRSSYNNWRLWANYMVVAVDVGELNEAARAQERVVQEIGQQDPSTAVDPDVLDKLVDSVTRDEWNGGEPATTPTTSNEGWGLYPSVDRLFEKTILPRISDNPRVWRAHARLLRWKEDWAGAIEDYIRAYRVEVADDQKVERDVKRWREAVETLEDLVATLQQLGPRVPKIEGKKGGDWKFQARGIVRTFMGRTRNS